MFPVLVDAEGHDEGEPHDAEEDGEENGAVPEFEPEGDDADFAEHFAVPEDVRLPEHSPVVPVLRVSEEYEELVDVLVVTDGHDEFATVALDGSRRQERAVGRVHVQQVRRRSRRAIFPVWVFVGLFGAGRVVERLPGTRVRDQERQQRKHRTGIYTACDEGELSQTRIALWRQKKRVVVSWGHCEDPRALQDSHTSTHFHAREKKDLALD